MVPDFMAITRLSTSQFQKINVFCQFSVITVLKEQAYDTWESLSQEYPKNKKKLVGVGGGEGGEGDWRYSLG